MSAVAALQTDTSELFNIIIFLYSSHKYNAYLII
jgi:hypothetical protein